MTPDFSTLHDPNVPTDPVVQVRPPVPGADFGEWRISQNLTDRWGDINFHDQGAKPLGPLCDNEDFLNHLRGQMWSEDTFIVRKDGRYGILFEFEFCSRESESVAEPDDMEPLTPIDEYLPHVEIVAVLQDSAAKLAERFPFAEFGIPHESQIVNDRPAVWAFVPMDASTAEQREALGYALCEL